VPHKHWFKEVEVQLGYTRLHLHTQLGHTRLALSHRHSGHHAGPTLAAGACARLSGCIIISPRRGVRWNWFVGDRGSRNACMVGRCAGSGAEVFVLGGGFSHLAFGACKSSQAHTRARARSQPRTCQCVSYSLNVAEDDWCVSHAHHGRVGQADLRATHTHTLTAWKRREK
jgi:hypothetical protein